MLRNISRCQDMTPAVSSCGSIATSTAILPQTAAIGSNAAAGDVVVELAQLRAPQTNSHTSTNAFTVQQGPILHAGMQVRTLSAASW